MMNNVITSNIRTNPPTPNINPTMTNGGPRPNINADYSAQVEQLKLFLAMAPANWTDPTQNIKKFAMSNGDIVSCSLWDNIFYITGTDVVKCLVFRFLAIGRPVSNMKKFEEGVFSDLRNLKPGQDASLQEPRSEFLEFLYKHNCVRTQKKQKVFYWYSVPHDRLFVDALERDLKREAMGQETSTSRAIAGVPQQQQHQQPFHSNMQNPDPRLTMRNMTPQMTPQNNMMPRLANAQAEFPMNAAFTDNINGELQWLKQALESQHLGPSDRHVPEQQHHQQMFQPHTQQSEADTMETMSSLLQYSFEDMNEYLVPGALNGTSESEDKEENANDIFDQVPSQELTPTTRHASPVTIASHTSSHVSIAPKVSNESPLLAPFMSNSGFSSTISLDGSPNYKKQRRRSSIFRMAQAKPYEHLSQSQFSRRHTQPNLFSPDMFPQVSQNLKFACNANERMQVMQPANGFIMNQRPTQHAIYEKRQSLPVVEAPARALATAPEEIPKINAESFISMLPDESVFQSLDSQFDTDSFMMFPGNDHAENFALTS